MKSIVNERLSHLSEEQINDLVRRYYNNEKIADLLTEYKIMVSPSGLLRLFPAIVHNDLFCPSCNINLHSERTSRSCIHSQEKVAYCPNCKHKNFQYCECKYCKTKREEAKLIEVERIKNILSKELDITKYKPISFDVLSLEQRIYIGALLTAGLEEDYSKIKPINEFTEPYAPSSLYQLETIENLVNNRIIRIHPCSSINSFSNVSNCGSYSYSVYEVNYFLNIECKEKDKITLIKELLNPQNVSIYDDEIILRLWKKIALEECKQYLIYKLNKVQFNYTIGDKTEAILIDLLDKYSTAQIFGIIWICTNNAVRYYHEKRVTKSRAANSVIGNCQRYAEKAFFNNWGLKNYSRPKECPQSALSHYFFYKIAKIGDDGFNFSPSKYSNMLSSRDMV